MKLFRKQVTPKVYAIYSECPHFNYTVLRHGYTFEEVESEQRDKHIKDCIESANQAGNTVRCNSAFRGTVKITRKAQMELEELLDEYTEEAQKLKALDE